MYFKGFGRLCLALLGGILFAACEPPDLAMALGKKRKEEGHKAGRSEPGKEAKKLLLPAALRIPPRVTAPTPFEHEDVWLMQLNRPGSIAALKCPPAVTHSTGCRLLDWATPLDHLETSTTMKSTNRGTVIGDWIVNAELGVIILPYYRSDPISDFSDPTPNYRLESGLFIYTFDSRKKQLGLLQKLELPRNWIVDGLIADASPDRFTAIISERPPMGQPPKSRPFELVHYRIRRDSGALVELERYPLGMDRVGPGGMSPQIAQNPSRTMFYLFSPSTWNPEDTPVRTYEQDPATRHWNLSNQGTGLGSYRTLYGARFDSSGALSLYFPSSGRIGSAVYGRDGALIGTGIGEPHRVDQELENSYYVVSYFVGRTPILHKTFVVHSRLDRSSRRFVEVSRVEVAQDVHHTRGIKGVLHPSGEYFVYYGLGIRPDDSEQSGSPFIGRIPIRPDGSLYSHYDQTWFDHDVFPVESAFGHGFEPFLGSRGR